MTKIIAKIISQKGKCSVGHKVGDEFVIDKTTPQGICYWAFHALFPTEQILHFGGAYPWEKDPKKAHVACPDPDNPVIFELRRVD